VLKIFISTVARRNRQIGYLSFLAEPTQVTRP
jgi:hypothetical protein